MSLTCYTLLPVAHFLPLFSRRERLPGPTVLPQVHIHHSPETQGHIQHLLFKKKKNPSYFVSWLTVVFQSTHLKHMTIYNLVMFWLYFDIYINKFVAILSCVINGKYHCYSSVYPSVMDIHICISASQSSHSPKINHIAIYKICYLYCYIIILFF